MKTEKLIAILKKYPGHEVLVHDSEADEYSDLEPEDVSLAYVDEPDSAGVHDVVVLHEDADDEDLDDLNKAVILWNS